MSYSKYYKEHGPNWLNISLLDIFKKMDISKTKKYLPIYINFFRNRLDDFEVSYNTDGEFQYIFETVASYIGNEKTKDLSFGELLVTYRFVDNMDREKIKTINKFCEFNEKGYFPGLDTTNITDFSLIESYVASLELKEAEKMFSKQAPKVYDDENWLVVRPISYESSLKYGATTKWCTVSSNSPEHFFRYSESGALFYILNKSKNYKVALFIPLENKEEGLSFWNQFDLRVDSMGLEFDYNIINFLKLQINSSKLCTNKKLDSEIWESSFLKQRILEKKIHPNMVPRFGLVTQDNLIDERTLIELPYPANLDGLIGEFIQTTIEQ
jgi:hypothetical protein